MSGDHTQQRANPIISIEHDAIAGVWHISFSDSSGVVYMRQTVRGEQWMNRWKVLLKFFHEADGQTVRYLQGETLE